MFRIISIGKGGCVRGKRGGGLRLVKGSSETRVVPRSYPDIFWFPRSWRNVGVKDNSPHERELVSPLVRLSSFQLEILFLPLPTSSRHSSPVFISLFLWYPILEASCFECKKKKKEKKKRIVSLKEYKNPLPSVQTLACPKILRRSTTWLIENRKYFLFERPRNKLIGALPFEGDALNALNA